ncbi:pre-mRNA processing factor 3-domain-containing protein [Lineolata rhizophorae]|uniref:Pre-mRNA processing factor 3-domain-containing protein n=1 Tax=Lineolata rhizophorae TaxID=578093 RepID=A0A6A6NTW6_9PEZI|nr:pre-mRNA processing factor 3-domain-containing protein [Lineolata rhizophorae]
MPEKRPPGRDDLRGGDAKRARSNQGPPAAGGAPSKAPSQATDIQQKIAEARAKAEAARARIQGRASGGNGVASPAPAASPPPPPPPGGGGRANLEAIKARVAAASAAANATARPRTASPLPPQRSPPQHPPPPPRDAGDGDFRARGGLGVGLHPALLADSQQQDGRAKARPVAAPKLATAAANRRDGSPASKPGRQLDLAAPGADELKGSPYFDPSIGGGGASGRGRHPRQLVFHQKGKFIQQANALRRQAALEAMKKRIAESARKVGLDEDNEKAFLVQNVPEVEWWDEGLVGGPAYPEAPQDARIEADDSIITVYVQHPVLMAPPQEKNAPAPKAMYLTKTEQAKLRRQRRMADHKEQQAKIRLGLEPPPPPKVKKSNLMRVLGEQAVKDPTAVEARVNREIAERRAAHEAGNEARKLSREQRAEKTARNQDRDAARGIHVSVYRVESLAFARHRYLVDVNAKEHGLTGVTILHPRFSLVVVEGGAHGIRQYRKLMLNRIRWTENAQPRGGGEAGGREAEAAWLRGVDEGGELKDLGFNRCTLVWEGEERERAFRRWGSRVCETDAEAKEALGRARMENFWTLAKTAVAA